MKSFQIYKDKQMNNFEHDKYISDIIEQSVRKESSGASNQNPLIRFLENILLEFHHN